MAGPIAPSGRGPVLEQATAPFPSRRPWTMPGSLTIVCYEIGSDPRVTPGT